MPTAGVACRWVQNGSSMTIIMTLRIKRKRALSIHRMTACWAVLGAAGLLATLPACGGGGDQSSGSLYVTVLDKSSLSPVANATVTTNPATQSLVTDALGSVFFAKIPAAAYAITATQASKGSGRVTEPVMAGAVTSATVVLNGIPPGSGGVGGQGGTAGAAGAGGATGTGGAGANGSGGSIGTGGTAGAAGAHGSGGIVGTGGAAGAHGSGGTGGTGGLAGSPGKGGAGGGVGGAAGSALVLATLTKDSNGVNLSWTATPSSAFATYRIYRNSTVINILQDGTSVQYRDETGQLGVSYTYQVGGVTAGGSEILSNTQMIQTGVYIDVGSQIERLIADPTRPYLYGVDKVNNSLHFIDLTSNTVEKTIYVGSSPVDCSISLEGKTLYVANFGSTEIAMVDLDAQSLTGTILVDPSAGTWGGNPYRLACTAGDTLVYTSMDQWNNLLLVNALTGATLNVAATIYEPDVVASPDGTSVYAGESGISTENLYRFDLVNGKLTSVDTSAGINSCTNATDLRTKDGLYVFYSGMKFLAKNLKSVLGTFSEGIAAINSDGSLAIGASHIFDGTTFSAKRITPVSTSTMVVSPDDKTLYLYDTTTSRIYLWGLN